MGDGVVQLFELWGPVDDHVHDRFPSALDEACARFFAGPRRDDVSPVSTRQSGSQPADFTSFQHLHECEEQEEEGKKLFAGMNRAAAFTRSVSP